MDLHTRSGHHYERGAGSRRIIAETNVAARPGAVAQARRLVRETAQAAQLPADLVDDLLICVSEACTNAIEAQLEAGADAPIALRCRADETSFAIEVQDCAGGGFDPATLAPRPPFAHPGHLDVERGWGIQLMRELVDRVEFEAVDDGTVVRLVVDRRS